MDSHGEKLAKMKPKSRKPKRRGRSQRHCGEGALGDNRGRNNIRTVTVGRGGRIGEAEKGGRAWVMVWGVASGGPELKTNVSAAGAGRACPWTVMGGSSFLQKTEFVRKPRGLHNL